MKQIKELKYVILLLAILTLMPFVLGASLTDSLINSTQSNTTINVTGTIYFDSLIVENGGIYFYNVNNNAKACNITTEHQRYVTSDIDILCPPTPAMTTIKNNGSTGLLNMIGLFGLIIIILIANVLITIMLYGKFEADQLLQAIVVMIVIDIIIIVGIQILNSL